MKKTNKEFDTTITLEKDILLVNADGSYSLDKAKNLFKKSIDSALLHNKAKIVIDVTNVTGDIPFLDRFDFSAFLANYTHEHAMDKVERIAVTGHEPIVHNERFGELVAVNRGLNLKVFTSMKEAVIWLNKK